MIDLREDLCRIWVAEDGSKSLRIARTPRGDVRITVWRGLGGEPLALERAAKWHPADPAAAASAHARRRLGCLCVELGDDGLGTTYDLMLAVANEDPGAFGGMAWRPVALSDRPHEVRIFPDTGASFYEAVLGPYDDFVEELKERETGWVTPLTTYRPATEAEAARVSAGGRAPAAADSRGPLR